MLRAVTITNPTKTRGKPSFLTVMRVHVLPTASLELHANRLPKPMVVPHQTLILQTIDTLTIPTIVLSADRSLPRTQAFVTKSIRLETKALLSVTLVALRRATFLIIL